MKVTLESTSKIVFLELKDGTSVQARVWEGKTESGIECHAYIPRIAVDKSLDTSQFERELRECRTPSAGIAAIPLRLIL